MSSSLLRWSEQTHVLLLLPVVAVTDVFAGLLVKAYSGDSSQGDTLVSRAKEDVKVRNPRRGKYFGVGLGGS